jgi:hypothetical protein
MKSKIPAPARHCPDHLGGRPSPPGPIAPRCPSHYRPESPHRRRNGARTPHRIRIAAVSPLGTGLTNADAEPGQEARQATESRSRAMRSRCTCDRHHLCEHPGLARFPGLRDRATNMNEPGQGARGPFLAGSDDVLPGDDLYGFVTDEPVSPAELWRVVAAAQITGSRRSDRGRSRSAIFTPLAARASASSTVRGR